MQGIFHLLIMAHWYTLIVCIGQPALYVCTCSIDTESFCGLAFSGPVFCYRDDAEKSTENTTGNWHWFRLIFNGFFGRRNIANCVCKARLFFANRPSPPRCYALNKFADNLIFRKNGLPRV